MLPWLLEAKATLTYEDHCLNSEPITTLCNLESSHTKTSIYCIKMIPRKWQCCCCCLVIKSCPAFSDPMDCSIPGSMEFSRQEYWSGSPFLSPGDLPDSRIEPTSPALVGGFFTIWVTSEQHSAIPVIIYINTWVVSLLNHALSNK